MNVTMGDKSVETLGSKFNFRASWKHFHPSPPKKKNTMLIFLFLRLHRPQCLHDIKLVGAGGDIRELMLDVNKIEYVLKHRKASFSKSVSTTFVAHCSSENFTAIPLFTCLTMYRHERKRTHLACSISILDSAMSCKMVPC